MWRIKPYRNLGEELSKACEGPEVRTDLAFFGEQQEGQWVQSAMSGGDSDGEVLGAFYVATRGVDSSLLWWEDTGGFEQVSTLFILCDSDPVNWLTP